MKIPTNKNIPDTGSRKRRRSKDRPDTKVSKMEPQDKVDELQITHVRQEKDLSQSTPEAVKSKLHHKEFLIIGVKNQNNEEKKISTMVEQAIPQVSYLIS